jgi:hypothetical protein
MEMGPPLLVTMAGGSGEQARFQAVKEAAKSLITGVAFDVVACSAGPAQDPPPPGPAWSWLTGYRPPAIILTCRPGPRACPGRSSCNDGTFCPGRGRRSR